MRNKVAGAIFVSILYLLLTAGLFYWHFQQELAAGNTPKEQRLVRGSIRNSELWFAVHRASGNPLNPDFSYRLCRLNLTTGDVIDTDFSTDHRHALPVWLGDSLFVYTYGGNYRAVDGGFVKMEPAPFLRSLCPPFLFDGQVTVIYDASGTDDLLHENARLAHWIEGTWVEGRRIVLPGMDRFWFDDPQQGRKVLFPRTSVSLTPRVSGPSGYYFDYRLLAVEQQQTVHLLLTDMSGMCSAYRSGLEFADQPFELPSALAPENAPHEATGWQATTEEFAESDWVQMVADKDGLLFVCTDRPQRIVRGHFDGRMEELTGSTAFQDGEMFPWIAVDESGNAILIHSDQSWGSATLHRIHGTVIDPPHLKIKGFQDAYQARWLRVCLRLISVWIVPAAVVLLFTDWLARRSARHLLISTDSRIQLASIGRRILAFIADCIVVCGLTWLTWRLLLFVFDVTWPAAKPISTDMLFDLEWSIRTGQFASAWQVLRRSPLGWLTLPLSIDSPYFGILMVSFLPWMIGKIYLEGRYGLTLGKWLMGIRTMKTSFRVPGYASALSRNVCYIFDLPLLLTPIPALISLLSSDRLQRLGDRLSDTIVVTSTNTNKSDSVATDVAPQQSPAA